MPTATQTEFAFRQERTNGRPGTEAIVLTMSPEAWLALEVLVHPELICGPYPDEEAPELTHAAVTLRRARRARRILRDARTSSVPLPDALKRHTSGSALDAVLWAEHELNQALAGEPLTAEEWLQWVEERGIIDGS